MPKLLITDKKSYYDLAINNNRIADQVCFFKDTGQIAAKGVIFGVNVTEAVSSLSFNSTTGVFSWSKGGTLMSATITPSSIGAVSSDFSLWETINS